MNTEWSEECTAIVLSFGWEQAGSLLCSMAPEAAEAPLRLPRILKLGSGPGRSFANLLGTLCREITDEESALRNRPAGTQLEQLLLRALLELRRDPAPRPPLPTPVTGRRRALQVALEHIEQHDPADIHPSDLVAATGVSIRTLETAFLERFQIGPMTFIKRLRLRRVHDALLTASPAESRVGDIAAEHGFYNGSSFAKLYRDAFGELPSATLERLPGITG